MVKLAAPRRLAAWALAVVAPAVITIGLIPLRSSLGLAGALLCALVPVVGVALLGGIGPAALAMAVAFGLCDFYYAPPLHSLRVDRLVDLVALITFAAVAAAVGGLVDVLTRQGVQAARAKSEAENLARLAADSMAAPGDLAEAVGAVRRAFDLDAVALLHNQGAGWEVEASAGRGRIERPEQATYQVEVARGRVLCLLGRVSDQDATLLGVFLDQLRLAQERSVLDRLQDDEPSAAG